MTNSRNNPATARRGILPTPRVPAHRPTGTSTKTRTHPCRPPNKWCSGARSRWCSSPLRWRRSSSGKGEVLDVGRQVVSTRRLAPLGAGSTSSGGVGGSPSGSVPAQPAGGVGGSPSGSVPAQPAGGGRLVAGSTSWEWAARPAARCRLNQLGWRLVAGSTSGRLLVRPARGRGGDCSAPRWTCRRLRREARSRRDRQVAR